MNPNVEDTMRDESAGQEGESRWWKTACHYLAHLIPRTHWTVYRREPPEGGSEQWVCIWRQWLGFHWDSAFFRVVEAA